MERKQQKETKNNDVIRLKEGEKSELKLKQRRQDGGIGNVFFLFFFR